MLLHRVERYLQRYRMAPARFGREAVGDPSFVFDLKDGREPRAATIARVEAYIARHAGSKSEMPAGKDNQ